MTNCLSDAKPTEEAPALQGPAVSGTAPEQEPKVDGDVHGDESDTPPATARPDVRDPPPTGPPG
ncbi:MULTISPECIES: hypothetical protein [Myxococcus]|uniref:Uncharacterized protein n=1 Tax=Myxococcus llanfairpwllgwyngyllgogerychwyrndrobwllllantysiliogogogochensis TaxID=2590453 RepID=A0A540WYN6_9BACT|nr:MULTISPECIES: hypothetical protein [Myxococcus]NTX01324.1 hypothetical protein [Myxococcus sp. CA040A]TQF14060.1 hypothetical protein FJV41_20525 [Myxococcus llanfairpwllgwyngyllgogerychwyrndrobwllllantysiliogogogochensis]